mmetsp:Transcript_28694/g.67458  ORF Transcript_28694/g.67458 Transcript_28694/m.67458 type:complete len:235 (-) Transcript_28694:127-831(-)
MVQLRKLARYKRLIGQSKKPNPEWRQWDGLLRPPKLHPTFERGYPQFEKPFDPANRLTPASQRKWRPPPQPRIVSRNSDDYNQDNLHELKSKFQFEVKGIFHDKGYMAEKEVFDTAFQLHLVGWLKVRATFILGHVQGDTYALSYFKKYLEEKHLSREAGTIDWVRLWEYNTGLEVPLSYRVLWCDKDWRKYRTRKGHMLSMFEKLQIREMEKRSSERRREELAHLDANCHRNY